jgi:hypothetical protein
MIKQKAIAIGLIGWYLLRAPLLQNNKTQNFVVGSEMYYRFWYNEGSFDTAAECQKVLEKKQARLTGPIPKTGDHAVDSALKATADSWAEAVCIASDDPRLTQ